MTTKRSYTCNVCRDAIRPTDGSTREGFGIYFLSHNPSANGSPYLMFRRPSECETHICLACAKDIHDELRKAMPAGTDGAEHG